ncbi:MAG: carboxylating nicotinate-nucleotide diphosphorylase [Lachnospiraceae bacterium]|nr:carboxylating nicotinate-nucleotide diphosphorylase [Lachnospiraceae bacterium]
MLNGVTLKINVDEYILNALREDITSEDVTTNAVMREATWGKADLICKQDGVVCGLDVFKRVFELLDSSSVFETLLSDGDEVKKGQLMGTIYGDIRVLLSGERTALNYLQRMSGIATLTHEMVAELKGYKTKLLDTRKTTPNMRPFEKHAVKVGGGTNHRYNLSDGILIKDNHIGAAGSITKAVEMAKEYAPFVRKIEVEVETLEQLKEAVEAGADIIMLDNMDNDTMKKAVELVAGKAQTECSGNVTKARLKEIAEIGVDFVSCGALTHSAPIMDISLKNLTPMEDTEEQF